MDGSDPASQVLLNREIIAVDQDPLGRPATLVLNRGSWQVWRKPLSGGKAAVAVVNLADSAGAAVFSWAAAGRQRAARQPERPLGPPGYAGDRRGTARPGRRARHGHVRADQPLTSPRQRCP